MQALTAARLLRAPGMYTTTAPDSYDIVGVLATTTTTEPYEFIGIRGGGGVYPPPCAPRKTEVVAQLKPSNRPMRSEPAAAIVSV